MADFGEAPSPREMDVLRCVADGLANKAIGDALSISPHTVKVHLRNIYTKLGVSSRTEAVTSAIQRGFLNISAEPDPKPVPALEPVPEPIAAPDPLPAAPATQKKSRRGLWMALSALLVLLVVLGVWRARLEKDGDVVDVSAELSTPFESVALSNQWRTERPLPVPISHGVLASVGLRLYQIGGEREGEVLDSVLVYDSAETLWKLMSPKPTAVADSSAAVLADQIYVVGGRLPSGEATATLEVYSPSNDAWRSAASLPQALYGASIVEESGHLYVIGGTDGKRYFKQIYQYEPNSDSWTPFAELEGAAAFTAAGVVDGKIVIAGGTDGENDLDDCRYYDLNAADWGVCPDLLLARSGISAVVLLNRLYLFGGGEKNDVDYAEVLDLDAESWKIVNVPMRADWPQWSYFGVAAIETNLILVGGEVDGVAQTGSYRYSPQIYQYFIPVTQKDK